MFHLPIPKGVKASLLNILTLGESQNPGTLSPYLKNTIHSLDPRTKQGMIGLGAAIFGPRLDDVQIGPMHPETGLPVEMPVAPVPRSATRPTAERQALLDAALGLAKLRLRAQGHVSHAATRIRAIDTTPNEGGPESVHAYTETAMQGHDEPAEHLAPPTQSRPQRQLASARRLTPQQIALLRVMGHRL